MLAGILVPLLVGGGSIGTFWLVSPQGGHPASRAHSSAMAAASATPSPSPSPSASPKRHRHRRHRHARHQRRHTRHALPPILTGHVSVGVAVKDGIVSGVRSFSRTTGAHMALVEIYAPFGAAFPQSEAGKVRGLGSTPLIQWDPNRAPVSQIAAGTYNGYVRHYADAVKAFGSRVVLSFGHEFNGTWNRWGAGHYSPAQFVAAWHRIHNIFASQGARNVVWSWDPSHTGDTPDAWWPGPAYVDRIGIDGYLRPGQTFADIFASRLADVRGFTGKPIYIAETGVAPCAGQASQIISLFNGVLRYHLSGFVYFDINHLEPWRLEGRPAAIRAFREAVAHTR